MQDDNMGYAGLGQVHFVPDPLEAALASIVGIAVVGRADEPCCGGMFW
jgi:hypothetical protein